jgi:hypothetical protein
VKFGKYSNSCPNAWCAALLLAVLVPDVASGQLGSVKPNIAQGQHFAHWVQFPARFQESKGTKGMLPYVFNYFIFRSSSKSPDVILVEACREELDASEICSSNSFAIETKNGYRTRPTEAGEWARGLQIKSQEMDDPLRRTIREEYAKSPFLKAIPIAPTEGAEYQGYKCRGNEYRRRGDWVGSLHFASSEDGSLIVLAGVDKRKFPHQEAASVAAAVYTIPWGMVTIDVFASDPSHHITAVDLDCRTTVDTARRGISLVDSRWLAINLDPFMVKMLLFDFKP